MFFLAIFKDEVQHEQVLHEIMSQQPQVTEEPTFDAPGGCIDQL